MKIKIKIFSLIAAFAMSCLFVNAQYTRRVTSINIAGTAFDVMYNEADQTFEIFDEKYKIDDREYALYGKKRQITDFKYRKNYRTLELPHEVTIGGKAYTLTSIGKAAFAGYTNIDEVIIPETVTQIEEYAFFRSSVKSVIIPPTVQFIGNRAFGHCTELKSLTMPKNIEAGRGLYAESKNCKVEYNADGITNPVAINTPANNPTRPASKPVTVQPSDVDIDIPVNKSNNENTFAIIIANENYQNEVDVLFAKQDGRTFRKYCSDVLGLPEENIRYRENATLNNINEEVDWISKVAGAFDGQANFIVYYAGHGVPDESNGNAYLLPIDGTGSNIKTGYSLNNLYKQLSDINAEHVTVFLDACFSGALRGDGMLASARGVAIRSKTDNPQGNMVVFTAAQGDETAWPYNDMGHGMFTYFLLKKLKETKGNVTMDELGTYITQQVKRRSILSNGKQQTPTVSASSSLGESWKNLKLK